MNTTDSFQLSELLAELSNPATTVERAEMLMAALDGLEPASLPTVFRWLHDASDEDALYAATRLLVRWSDREVAKALPPALRALIREPNAGDLNKIAAAGVLAVLGEPLHDADLAGYLRDPAAVMRAALRRLVDVRQGRLAVVNTLDRLSELPLESMLSLIDDLTELGDPRGARILLPLAHHADPDVAISAVAALDQLGAWRAASALAPITEGHPGPGVRSQAELSAKRLAEMRPEGAPEPGAVAGAMVRMVELPAERRVLLLSAPSPLAADERELLTLHIDAVDGIVESAVLERVSEEAVAAIETRLTAAGAAIDALEASAALDLLEIATAHTLNGAREDGPLGWTAWRELLAPVG